MNASALYDARRLFTNTLASSAATIGAMRVSNIAMGFLVMVLLANKIGAHDFGLFAFALSVTAIGSVIMRLGLPLFIVRESTAAAAKNDWGAYQAIARFSAITGLGSMLGIAAIMGFAFVAPMAIIDSEFFVPGLVGVLGASLMTLCTFMQARLRGVMEVTRAYAPEFIVMQGSMLIIILLLWATNRLSLDGALAAFVSAWLIAAASSIYLWTKYRPEFSPQPMQIIPWTQWLRMSGSLFLLGLTPLIIGKVEVFFLAAVAGPSAIGSFVFAFRIASVTSIAGFSVSSMFSPTISKLKAAGDKGQLVRLIRTATILNAAASTIIATGVCLFCWIAVPMIAPDLSGARYLTPILAVGFVAASLAGRSFDIAAMIGSAKGAIAAAAITLPLYAAMLFFATPAYHEIGAAIATAAAITIYAALLNIIIYRETGLRSDVFAAFKKQRAL